MNKCQIKYEPTGDEIMHVSPSSIEYTLDRPEPRSTKWRCEWGGPMGIVFVPAAGREPNWFHRKMQELAFGVKWVKQT